MNLAHPLYTGSASKMLMNSFSTVFLLYKDNRPKAFLTPIPNILLINMVCSNDMKVYMSLSIWRLDNIFTSDMEEEYQGLIMHHLDDIDILIYRPSVNKESIEKLKIAIRGSIAWDVLVVWDSWQTYIRNVSFMQTLRNEYVVKWPYQRHGITYLYR